MLKDYSQKRYYHKNKEKIKKYQRDYNKKNKCSKNNYKRLKENKTKYQEYKKQRRKYYYLNKEKMREKGKRFYEKNKEKILKTAKKKRQELKLKVFTHYGLKCACCSEEIYEFLTMEHKNNDGNEHRKEIGKGSKQLYKWLIKNNFPKEFETLCFNCNISKGIFGICPHKKVVV